MLVLVTNKKTKMSVNWIGPGRIESKISETNYILSIPGGREKSQIYHVNLLKPYLKRIELVNVLTQGLGEVEGNKDLEIAFPTAEIKIYNFENVIKGSNLHARYTSGQINQLKDLLDTFYMFYQITQRALI